MIADIYEIMRDCDNESEKKIAELQAENERLKGELKQTEAQDQVVIDGLRKENAKLKCLALHLFVRVGYQEYENWSRIRDGHPKPNLKKRYRWWRIAQRSEEAYRKAKAELRYSNG